MQRIKQNTTGTLAGVFQVDGENTDPTPATATVEILRADGTVLVAAGTATTRVAVGAFTYNLSTAQTATLDRLTAYWTSSLGTIETVAELVGGFYFTIAEFEARFNDLPASVTTEDIVSARTTAEDAYESAIGYACVPRFAHARSVSENSGALQLRHLFVRSVTAATDRDGNAVTVTDAIIDDSSYVDMSAGWGAGHPLRVSYTHGRDAPDAVDKDAVLRLARHYLLGANSPVDDRATSIAMEPGIVDLTVWPREVIRVVAERRVPVVA